MKSYEALTLGGLIDALTALGDADVRGLDGCISSYRGYYERNATEPCAFIHSASALADWYRKEIGKDIYGWKGGDYTVSPDELVYYAGSGDCGPNIIGLERAEDGVWEPVLLGGNVWAL